MNTKDIGTLAQELSRRFYWNIKYVEEDILVTKEEGRFRNADYTKIRINPSEIFFTLTDDNSFEQRNYYKKYQKYPLHYQELTALRREGKLTEREWEEKEMVYSSYGLHNLNQRMNSWVFQIYDFTAIIAYPYFGKWINLYNLFNKEYGIGYGVDPWSYDVFIKFRSEIKFYAHLLGSDKVYYVDDQSDMFQEMEGIYGKDWDESQMTWDEWEYFFQNRYADLLIDIPKFNSSKEYREFCFAEIDNHYGRRWNRFGYAVSAFADDFSDL